MFFNRKNVNTFRCQWESSQVDCWNEPHLLWKILELHFCGRMQDYSHRRSWKIGWSLDQEFLKRIRVYVMMMTIRTTGILGYVFMIGLMCIAVGYCIFPYIHIFSDLQLKFTTSGWLQSWNWDRVDYIGGHIPAEFVNMAQFEAIQWNFMEILIQWKLIAA